MPLYPLWGSGTKGRSSNVTSQKRVNLYLDQSDDKSDLVLYSRPGLSPVLFNNNATGFGGGPFRGITTVQRIVEPGTAAQQTIDIVFGAIGPYAVVSVNNSDRFLTTAPTVAFQTTSGPMVYADDSLSVLGVDGRSAYVSVYSGGEYTQTDIQSLGVTGFPYGATSICCLASRFIANDPSNKGRFWWSDPLDYATWDGLSFATAESIPDPLVAVYAWRGELLLFGSQGIEFWAATGGSEVFARTGGSGVPWGLASQQTIQEVDGALFFVGRGAGSDLEVVALQGYQASVVSSPDVEYDINNNSDGPLIALVVRKGGHTFYVLNLRNKTWAYNATVGEWDEWQTDGGRFAGQLSTVAYGRTTITDYRTEALYGLDQDAYVDGSTPMLRELQTKHLFSNLDRLTLWELALDVETGVGGYGPVYPRCLTFDGLTNDTGSETELAVTTAGSGTIEFIARPRDLALMGLFQKVTEDGPSFQITCEAGVMAFAYEDVELEFECFPNEWAHYAFTFDGATLTALVNAVVVGTVAATDIGLTETSTVLNIGNLGLGVSPFKGEIGLIRVWDYARTPAQILAAMHQTVGTPTTGLQAQWASFPDGANVFNSTGTVTDPIALSYGTRTANMTVYELSGGDTATIMLQVSKDGGHTWGNELWQSLGRVGEYAKRVVWKRLGRARDFVFRFRVSDPVKVVLIGASVRVDQ